MELDEFILNGMESLKRGFERALDGLSPAELKWQPRPDANSIGLIYFHSIRHEDSTIHMLQGKPQIWETQKWYQKFNKTIKDGGAHYTPEQVAAFAVPDMKELAVYAEAVRKDTLEYLKGLKAADFDRKIEMPSQARPGFNPVVGAILLRMLMHLSQHVGDTSYIRGLQRGMDK